MAKTSFPFSNGFGDISMYKQKGIDDITVRTKGGPSKKQVKTSSKFKRTRQLNIEFTSATKLASKIHSTLFGLKQLGDYRIIGVLTKISIFIQKLDMISSVGKREIILSNFKSYLHGFSLNRVTMFDTVVKTPTLFTLSRDNLLATVKFPELRQGINFFPPGTFGYYRFIAVIGIVSDVKFVNKKYKPINPLENYNPVQYRTDWFKQGVVFPEIEIKLNSGIQIDDACTMILSVGIEFGNSPFNGVIQAVKYFGCAKVLGVE